MTDLIDSQDLVKSLIISHPGPFFFKNLDDEFKEESGMSIPYKELGFNSLTDFLLSISGITLSRTAENEIVLKVETENSKHIQKLVNKQKKKVKKRNKSAPGRTENIQPDIIKEIDLKNSSAFKSTADLTSPEKANQTLKKSKKKPKNKSALKNLRTTENPSCDVRGLPFKKVSADDDDAGETCACVPKSIASKIDYKRCSPFGKCVRFSRGATEDPWGHCSWAEICGFCMVGDDIFYHFAKDYLQHEGEMKTCKVGLTVAEAEFKWHDLKSFPENVIILIGSSDVYLGRTVEDIAQELFVLVGEVQKLVRNVIICTIPNLGININKKSFDNLLRINRLIRGMNRDFEKVEVIDLYSVFSSDVKFESSKFFEQTENNRSMLNETGFQLLQKILEERLFEYYL